MRVGIVLGVTSVSLLVAVPALAWGVGSPNPAPTAPVEPPAPVPPAEPPPAALPPPSPAPPVAAPAPAPDTATPLPESAPLPPADAKPIPVELEETPAPAPPPKRAHRRALPPSLSPPPTSAEAPPADELREEGPRERPQYWYGWQLLIADGGSLALMLAGESVAGWGVLGYLFAPPIVHRGHGHTAKGFGSLGLRIGLPIVGVAMGAFVSDCTRSSSKGGDCNSGPLGAGLVVGMAGAIAIDAALLGYEDAKRHRSSAQALSPVLSVGKHDARVGLAGSF